MKNKIASILICTLLIATSIVMIPNDKIVRADTCEETGPINGLDYEYLWTQIDEVAEVIHQSYSGNDIAKGRFMGSIGGQDACYDIIKYEMNEMSLDNVRTEKLEKITKNNEDIYYDRVLEVVGYNLTVNNTEYEPSNDIPKSEVFPTTCTKKVEGGYDYTIEFDDAEIDHINFRLKLWENWFDSSYEISDYDTYNEEYDEFIGKLEYLTEQSQAPDPNNQSGRVYLFDRDDYSQDFLDNLTSADGVVLIDIGEDIALDFSNNAFQVKEIGDSEGDDLTDILNNNSDVMINSLFDNITVYYEFNGSILPDDDYVIIDRIPDHIELAEDDTSSLLTSYFVLGNDPFPTLMHYLGCVGVWSWIFTALNLISEGNCVSFILYSSFDHHIMLPTNTFWEEENKDYKSNRRGERPIPFFCVNESLGEFLNDTREDDPPTKISGDIHQDYYAGTAQDPGIESYNAIGEINIDESPEDEYFIISNRYDGMWGETPGDSGIGTAIVLGLARHQKFLQQNYSIDPKYNITYLFTTGEEMGFRGAYYHRDNLSEEDRNNIKMWIGFDQLGMDQSDLVLAPECRSPNDGGNASRNMDIVWAIANLTNYEDLSEYDFEPSVETGPGGAEDVVWGNETCDTIVFVKDNARAWDRWHATGRNYTNGDSLKYTDYTDVNLTYEMAWHFVKYFLYDTDCWFGDVTYTPYDSIEDGDSLNDSINVTFNLNTKTPVDIMHIKVNRSVQYEGGWSVTSLWDEMNYTVNRTEEEKKYIFTVPSTGGEGNYSLTFKVYNFTETVNEFAGIDSFSYNDSDQSSYFKLYPYVYDTVGPSINNVTDSPDPVGFGFNVTISADVTDDDPGNASGVQEVKIIISYPGPASKNGNFTMSHIGGDTYKYVFDDTWFVGQYNYTIWAVDNANNSVEASQYSFNVSAQATINVATLKDTYGRSEYINITDPPSPPEDYYLTSRGLTYNKYYNAVSGNDVIEAYTTPVNYFDNDGWTPINHTLETLEPGHPAYQYGYRAGNERGLYSTYFKPNIQDNWQVAFAFDKSDNPTTHVVRSKLVGVGYLDPSSDWDYEYLQSAQSSTGQIDGNSITYEDVFTGTDVKWSYGSSGLKEDIIMGTDAETMLSNNPPSDFGLSNTDSYLVFITRFDYQGLTMYDESGDLTGNVTITENGVDFKDALGDFKCALPVGVAYEQNDPIEATKLIYRIIQYNGNYYLLSGLKVIDLNDMTFPVVVDPTLTTYSSSSDGYIVKSNSDYNTAWSSSTGTVVDTYSYFYIGQRKASIGFPPSMMIYRGFVFFNTSSIPSNTVITSANLSLYKYGDYSTTDFDIVVQNGQPTYPHDPLVSGDYDKNHYSGDGGSMNTSGFSNGYNDISLTNYSWINEDGWTKLCLRSSRDINAIEPTNNEYVTIRSYEYPSMNTPKLVIEYRNQSKIKNTGSTNISGYLFMKIDFNDPREGWITDQVVINEETTRTINTGEQLALDLIFNGEVSTDDLENGDGTYRVYTAFRDPDDDPLVCDDESLLEAWYEFEVDTS